MENKTVQEEKNLLKIDNDPIEFESVADVQITNTNELAKTINALFKCVFADFVGSSIEVSFDQSKGYLVKPRLFFKLLPKDAYRDDNYYGFNPISATAGSDPVARRNTLSIMKKTTVEATEDFKNAMAEFMAVPSNTKIDWNKYVDVKQGADETLICVNGLHVNKIISKIYGNKDADKQRLEYLITVTQPIGVNQYKAPDNWGVQILRLSEAEMYKASEKLGWGIPSISGTVQFVKA